MATSLVPESAVRACSAAPVPRPPQPTRPTLIVLLPAAWTRGTVKPVEALAATAAVEPFRKSRREAGVDADADVAVGLAVEVGQSRRDLRMEGTIRVDIERIDSLPRRIIVTRCSGKMRCVSVACVKTGVEARQRVGDTER